MKRRTFISGLVLLPMALGKNEEQEPFAVIVNKSNRFESLSRAKLNYIFLRKVSRWPWGAEVLPITSGSGALQESFTSGVLRSSPQALAVYWIDQKATRNIDPPLRAPSVEEALNLVAARPGAIAYVPGAAAADSRVKQLRIE